VKAHRVVRGQGSHIFYTISSQMAARWSALRVGRTLPPGRFLVLISVRGWVDPRAIVRLEGLGQLKNPMTSSGIEPAAFRLVAQCLNRLSVEFYDDWWTVKWKGFERKWPWPSRDVMLAFVWTDERKSATDLRITSAPVDIRTHHLLNACLECLPIHQVTKFWEE
jgi:hypothetical protein